MKLLISICLLLLITEFSFAQTDDNYFGIEEDDIEVQSTDTIGSDTMVIVKNSFFEIFKGEPGKAALYSLLIPAGGQAYNKKWWKVPLALAIDGVNAYFLISNQNKYLEWKNIYIDLLNGNDNNKYGLSPDQANIALNQRNTFRQYREYNWVFFIIGHLVTVFDAYVDRHLMSFDISDDLSFTFKSQHNQFLSFGISIPLSTRRKHAMKF